MQVASSSMVLQLRKIFLFFAWGLISAQSQEQIKVNCPEINFCVNCKQYFTASSGLNKSLRRWKFSSMYTITFTIMYTIKV